MNKGTRFYNCDFQVHSPRDINWSGSKPTTDQEREVYANRFVLACRQKGINAVAITDHHDLAFFPYIKSAANDEVDDVGEPIKAPNKLTVFPGVELTLSNPPSQALLLLDADYPEDQLLRVLHTLSLDPSPITEPSTIQTVPIPSEVANGLRDLYAKLDSVDALKGRYIVLPHTSRGHKGILRRDFYEHYIKMPCVSGYVDGAIPDDEGWHNIIGGRDRNYGFRSVAVFQTSDNRKDTFEDLGAATTWVKWATPTAEALRQASLAKESRMSLFEPNLPQVFIGKLSVTNSKFLGRIELDLNQQYNSFIGGRGTGKSTLLEYIRWGLCDQAVGELDSDSEIVKRRQILIEKTLVPFSGEVRITASINGIEHIVKRSSSTKEIQLKIGVGDFERVTEEEIRRLIPVQAYSQKQLSNVGVRTDELKRFIQQPIFNELNNITFNLREVSKNLKNAYGNLVRKKEIQGEIDELKLQHKSVGEQVINLRKSLKGLTDEEKKIIENKEYFENEKTLIQESDSEISLFEQKFLSLSESLSNYPSEGGSESKILNLEVITSIQAEKNRIFTSLKDKLSELLELFSADSLSPYRESIKKWDEIKKTFDSSYIQIKDKASSNESIIKDIGNLENRLRELTDSINERVSRIKELGNPEVTFSNEKQRWYDLHQSKIDLLNTQAVNFTTLSNGIIQAEVTRSINIRVIQDSIIASFAGTRISREKIDSICEGIRECESPLDSWKAALNELRLLAEYKILEDKPIELPETPYLTDSGLNETNLRRIIEQFSPEVWLSLLTQEIEFEPTFSYSTGNEMQDVIPFAEASAGQQATALLAVLLNQEGMPLIIDQPEDDIDNRAINDVIESIWHAKSQRQLIFTSHNANLVVNGDAELVVCCDYKESSQQTQGEIKLEGAIDNPEIRKEITSIMEGGERAFKLRKEKYGF